MKRIFILISFFALLTTISRGQSNTPPDSLGVVQETDSTFRVIEGYSDRGYYLPTPPLDKPAFDSAGVANFANRAIAENEDRLRAALQVVLAQRVLTATYNDANKILVDFTGEGYIPRAWGELQSEFAGFWQADSSNVTRYLRVFAEDLEVNGTEYDARDVVRVNASGNPVGSVLGTFWGIRPGLFQTNSFSGATTGARGTRWVKMGQRRYLSNENDWRMTWLGRTFEEALSFLSLQNNN